LETYYKNKTKFRKFESINAVPVNAGELGSNTEILLMTAAAIFDPF